MVTDKHTDHWPGLGQIRSRTNQHLDLFAKKNKLINWGSKCYKYKHLKLNETSESLVYKLNY